MPFIINPEILSSMTSDATPDALVKRDEDASIKVGLKFPEWAKGYPLPMHIEYKDTLNILTWDGTYSSNTSFSGGEGTEDDPYIISTPSELAFLSRGAHGTTADKYYKIADGIDAFNMNAYEGITLMSTTDDIENASEASNRLTTGYNGSAESARAQFMGNFDGSNIIVYNLYSSGAYAGLFPTISTSSTLGIKNLIIKSSKFVSTSTQTQSFNGVGAIVGAHTNWGSAEDVTSSSYPFPIENCVVMDCVLSGKGPIAYVCGNTRYAPIKINNCLLADCSMDAQSVNTTVCGGACAASQTGQYDNAIKNTVYIHVNDSNYFVSPSFDDVTDTSTAIYEHTKDFWRYSIDSSSCYTDFNWADASVTGSYPTYLPIDTLQSESSIQHTKLDPIIWRASCINNGESVTLDYLLGLFGSTLPVLSQLKKVSDKQHVPSLYVTTEIELDYNCMYFIWANKGSADAKFLDSVTNERVADPDGEALPSIFCGFLFLPDESYTVGPSKTLLESTRRCMILGATKKPSATNLFSSGTFVTKQFIMEATHSVKIAAPSDSLLMFKIQL